MKNLLKRLLTFCIAAVALCTLSTPSLAATPSSPSEITVLIGSEPVTFQDAAPEMKNGRTFVPVRAIFEALGAEVSYDDAAKTATAVRGDTTVRHVIGTDEISVNEDGDERTIIMDVASYVANNRTMVPARFCAEAFSCTVGWDAYTRTVLILDVDGLLSANNATYSLINKYLASPSKFAEGCSVTGTFKLDVTVDDEGMIMPFIVEGEINEAVDSSALNLDISMTMEIDELLDALAEEDSLHLMTALSLQMLEDLKVEFILNIEDQMMYLRCAVVAELMGYEPDTWFSTDMSLTESIYPLPLTDSADSKPDFKELVAAIISIQPLYDADSLSSMAEALTLINTIFSDAGFKKDGDTYTTTLDIDEDEMSSSFSFSMTLKDDTVTAVALSCTMSGSDDEVMDINMSMDANGKLELSFKLDVPDEMARSITASLQYEELTTPPATEPEDGSTIVPLEDLIA
jgi:hypothetical protein